MRHPTSKATITLTKEVDGTIGTEVKSNTMTKSEIKAARERAEKATPLRELVTWKVVQSDEDDEDGIFYDNARTDIPALCDHIAELEAKLTDGHIDSFRCEACDGTGKEGGEDGRRRECQICDGDPVITYEEFAEFSRQITRYRGAATLAEKKQREAEQQLADATRHLGTTRQHLWMSHGHKGLYGDDGEMQCSVCGVDYKRDDIELCWSAFIQAVRDRRQGEQQQLAEAREALGMIVKQQDGYAAVGIGFDADIDQMARKAIAALDAGKGAEVRVEKSPAS